jgi:hypothetical protein
MVFGDQALRTLLLFGWLVVFYAIRRGIAAPYAAQLGGGPRTARPGARLGGGARRF